MTPHTPVRNFFNLVADILTLLLITVAAAGHLLPWVEPDRSGFYERERALPKLNEKGEIDPAAEEQLRADERKAEEKVLDFQVWHATRSGIALGVLAVLVCLSLLFRWSVGARRWLTLLMFAAGATAVAFQVLPFSVYPITPAHLELRGSVRYEDTFLVALIPTCIAAGLCLIRMIWTMPPVREEVSPHG